MLEDVKKLIEDSTFEKGKIYLLEVFNPNYGLFYADNFVYFGTPSGINSNFPSLKTTYLELNFKVGINSINNNSSFNTGNYDLLKYKGDNQDSLFDIFYSLCKNYSEDQNGLLLFDFFNTIKSLFGNEEEDKFKGLIGLLGELILIKYLYENYKINICENWHKTGTSFSKFDFSFDSFNIETKTSPKNEKKFLLKHDQLFNNQKNYICVINLIETGTNISLNSLIDYFNSNDEFKTKIKFHVNLSKELKKFKTKEDFDRGFSINTIQLFDKDEIPTINSIPQNITNISYEYDFEGLKLCDFSTIFNN